VIRYDPKTDLPRLVAEADDIDVALVILHGPFGEDGTVQGLLDLLGIPYQGAGVLGSAAAMNKLAAKRLYAQCGLPVPAYRVIDTESGFDADACIADIGLPLVVKPVAAGSSVGMTIVRDASALKPAVQSAFAFDRQVLAEAFVDGVEVTGGVIGNDDVEALPLIEIIPGEGHEFFDYAAKYTPGATQEICPARIDADLTEKAQRYAVEAHMALFCRGYSRTDMILKDGEFYVLETNTIPGMTQTSLFPQAAAAAGMDFTRLLDRLIELALA
jgi:D-alanine-D-alanine ligase